MTGSRAYRRTAGYVASRLQAYEIQPGLKDHFLISYSAAPALSYDLQVIIGSSPNAFVTGVDVLRGARTDAGRVEVEFASLAPRGSAPASVRPLVLTRGKADSLRALREAGARAVLQVGALTPRQHRRPVSGLLVGRITPAAAQRLLGVSEKQLARFLAGGDVATWGLPEPVRVQVRAEQRAMNTEAVNVLGFVAGRDPNYIDDAVLVCADLDALGEVDGVATRDFRSFGIGAAAMLEAARNVRIAAAGARSMQRSLIVAFWSGSKQGHQGLRDYLHSPLWSLDRTRAVYYVGLSPQEQPAVRSLLNDYGLRLHAITRSGEPLFSPARYMMPSEARRRRAQEAPAPRDPNMDAVTARGAGMARHLSEVTFQVLLGALSGPRPFAPANMDTLRIPKAIGEVP